MLKKIYISILIITIIGLTSGNIFADQGIIDKIRASYQSIKDIKGVFEQTNNIGGKSKAFNAEFFIKIPKKMFWRYEGKDAQEVYINNPNIVFYQPKYKQAYVSTYNQSTSGLKELTLLEGLGDVEKYYAIKEMEGFIRLTPNSPDSKINYIEIYPSNEKTAGLHPIGDFPIDKIIISGKDENNITIKIKKAALNTGIADSIFNFTPPQGTTLLDQ